jgi:hypothetical protein
MNSKNDTLNQEFIPNISPLLIFKTYFQLQYFTQWSNMLFYLTLIWMLASKNTKLYPPSWFIDAVLVNMLSVCIVGNLIYIVNPTNILEHIQETYPSATTKQIFTSLSASNVIYHTAPGLLAAGLLFANIKCNTSTKENKWKHFGYSIAFLSGFSFLWNLVPYDNKLFYGKAKKVYLNPPSIIFLLTPLLWIILLLIKYLLI